MSSEREEVITTPGELYRQYQHRTKKRLGQHFLIDPNVLDEIVALADIQTGDVILEVGPGCGTLTLMMMHRGGEVSAVEVDRDAARFLEETLVEHYPLEVIEGDALAVDLGEILSRGEDPWKVVANLPYNVGTEILFRLFEHADKIDSMTLMFQREVATRIVAEPGDSNYGTLSLMAQLHSEVHLAMTLAPGAFVPPPKVHSSVVQFRPLVGTRIPDDEVRKAFQRNVRGAFQMRRKTLSNGLGALGHEKGEVEDHLEAMGLRKKIRPERVRFEEFEELTRRLMAKA